MSRWFVQPRERSQTWTVVLIVDALPAVRQAKAEKAVASKGHEILLQRIKGHEGALCALHQQDGRHRSSVGASCH